MARLRTDLSALTIVMYTKFELQRQKNHNKIIPFVEVTHNGKTCFIRKTTTVWLFQECEKSFHRLPI